MVNIHTENDITPAILIPCYNCGASVIQVVEQCRRYTHNIVTVNDGSTDDTANYLQQCPAETIGWQVNQGKGTALVEGFRYLLDKSDWLAVVTMDSDGQHDPNDLPLFINCYKETRADLIIGRRNFQNSLIPLHRRWANTLSSLLISLITQCKIKDFQSGYRFLTREAVKTLLPHFSTSRFALETEMVLLAKKLEMKINEVDIRCIYTPEAQQKSTWKPILDSWHITKVVTKHLLSSRHP